MATRESKDLIENSNLCVIKTINNPDEKKPGYYFITGYEYSVEKTHKSIAKSRKEKDVPKAIAKLARDIENNSNSAIGKSDNSKNFTSNIKEASVFSFNEAEQILTKIQTKDKDAEVFSYFTIYPKDDYRKELDEYIKSDKTNNNNLYNIVFPDKRVDEEVFNARINPIKTLVDLECEELGYDLKQNCFLQFLRHYMLQFPNDLIISENQYGVLHNLYAKSIIDKFSFESGNTFMLNQSLYRVSDVSHFEFILKAYYGIYKLDTSKITSKKALELYDNKIDLNILRNDIIFGKLGDKLEIKGAERRTRQINSYEDIKTMLNSLEGTPGDIKQPTTKKQIAKKDGAQDIADKSRNDFNVKDENELKSKLDSVFNSLSKSFNNKKDMINAVSKYWDSYKNENK